jgi:hypothetical protein
MDRSKIDPNTGAVTYPAKDSLDYFVVPRTEFLIHQLKTIENKIIEWYKKTHYSQGDSYSVRITGKGKWAVRYSNDYPMQHGSGKEHILTEEDFINSQKF